MVVTAFYYLSYPDGGPEDPSYGATEMYVERGQPGDTTEHFVDTLSFRVLTFRYLQAEHVDKGRPLVGASVMVVPTLDDNWMREYLSTVVDDLHLWGEPHGL